MGAKDGFARVTRRLCDALTVLVGLVAAGVVVDDVYTWYQAHPGLAQCMSDAYASYGPDGGHACPTPHAFSWGQAIAAMAIAGVAVSALVYRRPRGARAVAPAEKWEAATNMIEPGGALDDLERPEGMSDDEWLVMNQDEGPQTP